MSETHQSRDQVLRILFVAYLQHLVRKEVGDEQDKKNAVVHRTNLLTGCCINVALLCAVPQTDEGDRPEKSSSTHREKRYFMPINESSNSTAMLEQR